MAIKPAAAAQGARKAEPIAATLIEELWFADEDPLHVKEQAARSLSAKVGRLRGLKPFPVVAQRVMTIVSDQRARLEEVSRVLETDPSLASRTLRLANSALFLVGRPCDSVSQAVLRVGTKTLYEMMAAIAVLGMFEDARGVGLTIRDHCVGTAAVGRALVKRNGWSGGAQVFLTGLLHDVGKLLLMQTEELPYDALPPEYLAFDQVHLHERRILGYDHAVLGGHVLVDWKIPDPVCKVVAWHHQPGRAYAAGGDEALMVAILRLADRIDHQIVERAEPDGAFLAALAGDAGTNYLELSVEDVVRAWPSLVEARAEALTVFAAAAVPAKAAAKAAAKAPPPLRR